LGKVRPKRFQWRQYLGKLGWRAVIRLRRSRKVGIALQFARPQMFFEPTKRLHNDTTTQRRQDVVNGDWAGNGKAGGLPGGFVVGSWLASNELEGREIAWSREQRPAGGLEEEGQA